MQPPKIKIFPQDRNQQRSNKSWSTLFCFPEIQTVLPQKNSASFHTCKVERGCLQVVRNYKPIKRGEKEMCDVMSDVQMRREVTPIYTNRWGCRDTSLGLYLTKANFDNLCMRENKFKIPLLFVRMRWSLYQNSTSRKEESNAIIISII